jgi:GNAT superfamily N-acetyltransferase
VPDTVGWIDTLGVDPSYQRRGIIGRALFNVLIESFKRSGREEMLETKEVEKRKVEGMSVVYTLASWNDWDLMQFYHAMGLKRGEMPNLELKIR